jgi:hypothetical protein
MSARPEAFVFFGVEALARYPEFGAALDARRLRVLVVDEGAALDARPDDAVLGCPVGERLAVDPADLHRMLAWARGAARRYAVRGVFNTKEAFVRPASVVADLLGLPHPGVRAALIASDKYLQRAHFAAISPAHVLLRSGEPLPEFGAYPAALKPTARHGGSGIRLVHDGEELRRALDGYPPGEALVVEEFVDGIDVSVETLVWQGEPVFASITEESDGSPEQRFLEMGYTMPAVRIAPDVAERVHATNRALLAGLTFENGMLHAEYKVTPEGRVVLMECAARSPGDGLLPMYLLSTGRPIEAEIVKIALGERPSYPSPARWVRQVYFEHPPGVLVDVRVDGLDCAPVYLPELAAPPRLSPEQAERGGLHQLLVERARGDRMGELREAADRCGSVIFSAADPAGLDRLEDDVRRRLRVVTR